MEKKYRRRKFLINKVFQYKMLLISFVITGPIVLIVYLSYRFFVNSLIDRVEILAPGASREIMSALVELGSTMRVLMLVGVVTLLTFNAVVFLFLSHAIAGPIEKLKGHLRRKANNEKTGPFSIRTSDFFPELPAVVNEVFKDN
jgi:hypothetical protein